MSPKLGKIAFVLLGLISLLSCSDQETVLVSNVSDASSNNANGEIYLSFVRWYDNEQLALGREVFVQHCAVCHGEQAQGIVEDWREKLDDGSYPPPPLNGSAHAWHHSQEILLRVIDQGGQALGGKMPAFVDVLEHDEKLAAIAYFQSFWSEEIYQRWMKMGGTN